MLVEDGRAVEAVGNDRECHKKQDGTQRDQQARRDRRSHWLMKSGQEHERRVRNAKSEHQDDSNVEKPIAIQQVIQKWGVRVVYARIGSTAKA